MIIASTRSAQRRWLPRLDPYLLLLLLLSSLALYPLAAPGYFYGAHDGRHSVFYLAMFDASIRDGALWPRWAMHHLQGYGYPTFLIQAPLGFYLAEFFVLLGGGYTLAAKLAWVTGFLVGAWGLYRLTLRMLDGGERAGTPVTDRARLAALVAALAYVYAPPHLVGIYVRAALNDTLLYAWYPWVLLAFDRLIGDGTAPGWPQRLALAALVLAGTLLTHTFALISFLPLLVTFVLFRLWSAARRRPSAGNGWGQRGLLALTAGGAALLLCMVFLLPLLTEGRLLQQGVYVGGTYDFRNHFVQPSQFFSSFWGTGFSDDPLGANDGMSFQIGLIATLVCIAAAYLLLRRRLEPRGDSLYFLLVTVGLLLVMTPAAAPLWEAVPFAGIIQFPWRLLALAALTTSVLAGPVTASLLADRASPAEETAGAFVLALLVIGASYGYIGAELQPVEPWREDGRAVFRFEAEHPDMIAYTALVEEPYTTSPMTTDYAAEGYVEDYGPDGPLTRLAVLRGRGEVLSHSSRGSSAGGVVRMSEPGIVRAHLTYFPGWQAYVDGQPVETRVSDPHGLIEFEVPAGEHRIDVRMESTPVRRIGALLSWAALSVTLGLLLIGSRSWRRNS